jgi:hypothetical protein
MRQDVQAPMASGPLDPAPSWNILLIVSLISQGPALLASSLSRGDERRILRDLEVPIGYSG